MLFAGALVLYVERGGKTLLSWTDGPELLRPAAAALAAAVREGALGRLTVETADGGIVGRVRLPADPGPGVGGLPPHPPRAPAAGREDSPRHPAAMSVFRATGQRGGVWWPRNDGIP